MAVGFDSNVFDVLVEDDGRLPLPIPDEDGLETYSATVQMASSSVLDALRLLHSKVTILPAMAGGGMLVTERGPGAKHLIYPDTSSSHETRFAILIAIEAHPLSFRADFVRADLTFLLGDVIP